MKQTDHFFMNSNREDQFARRVLAHLGREPEVSDRVARRLAEARQLALSRVPSRYEHVQVRDSLAWRLGAFRYRVGFWLTWLALALYCAMLAGHTSMDTSFGWDADEDDSPYVELLHE